MVVFVKFNIPRFLHYSVGRRAHVAPTRNMDHKTIAVMAIASRLEHIAPGLKAIASRLEAIAMRFLLRLLGWRGGSIVVAIPLSYGPTRRDPRRRPLQSGLCFLRARRWQRWAHGQPGWMISKRSRCSSNRTSPPTKPESNDNVLN